MTHVRIFNHYIPSPLIFLGGIEAGLLFLSMLLGYSVGYEYRFLGDLQFDYTIYELVSAVVFAVIMLSCTSAMGVYSAGLRDGSGAMAVRTVVAYCLLGCVSLTIIYYLAPVLYIGRGVLASSIVIALFMILPVRWIYLRLVDGNSLRSRILVLGAGERAAKFADELQRGQAGLARIVGFVDTGGGPALSDLNPINLDEGESLIDVVRKYEASEIVIALDDRRLGGQVLPMQALFDCKDEGCACIRIDIGN